MKKTILLLLIIALAACSKQTTQPTIDKPDSYCKVGKDDCGSDPKEMYKILIEDETFKPISMQEAITLFQEEKSGFIYFGFSNCPWCYEALPLMLKAAKDSEESIYYVQTRNDDRELMYTEEEKALILEYVKDYEDQDEEGNTHLYVPLIVKVENGKCVDGHLGTLDAHDAHERSMTEEEKMQLLAIYQDMFK